MAEILGSTAENPRESLEKSLPEILDVLEKSYRDQGTNTYSLKEASDITKRVCNEISGIFMKNGISKSMNQMELISLFSKQGYSFTVSPMNIGAEKYIVNHPLYRLGKKELYDMSSIRFDQKYNLPVQKIGIMASLVDQTLIPDIRKIKSGFELDGVTISDPITNTSSMLLFPDKIRENAGKNKQNPVEYKKVVVMNEMSQVYLLKIIPIKYLGVELNQINIPAPKGITIHHLLEAFSDLCSLKFSKGGKHEVLRILGSKDNGYELSHLILTVDLKSYFPMMTIEGITKKIQNMNPDEYKKLNEYIIEGYEQNTLPVIARISASLSKMK